MAPASTRNGWPSRRKSVSPIAKGRRAVVIDGHGVAHDRAAVRARPSTATPVAGKGERVGREGAAAEVDGHEGAVGLASGTVTLRVGAVDEEGVLAASSARTMSSSAPVRCAASPRSAGMSALQAERPASARPSGPRSVATYVAPPPFTARRVIAGDPATAPSS